MLLENSKRQHAGALGFINGLGEISGREFFPLDRQCLCTSQRRGNQRKDGYTRNQRIEHRSLVSNSHRTSQEAAALNTESHSAVTLKPCRATIIQSREDSY